MCKQARTLHETKTIVAIPTHTGFVHPTLLRGMASVKTHGTATKHTSRKHTLPLHPLHLFKAHVSRGRQLRIHDMSGVIQDIYDDFKGAVVKLCHDYKVTSPLYFEGSER